MKNTEKFGVSIVHLRQLRGFVGVTGGAGVFVPGPHCVFATCDIDGPHTHFWCPVCHSYAFRNVMDCAVCAATIEMQEEND